MKVANDKSSFLKLLRIKVYNRGYIIMSYPMKQYYNRVETEREIPKLKFVRNRVD